MTGQSSSLIFEALLSGVKDTARQLQRMIDAVVAMQEIMPIPAEGWAQFVRDIEYTNEKHGLGLSVPCWRMREGEAGGNETGTYLL